MPEDPKGWSQRPLTSSDAQVGASRAPVPHAPSRSAADGDRFDPAAAYLARLGEGSRRTMREALAKLAEWASDGRCSIHELAWHSLRLEQTAALRTRLAATLAPATANKHLAALRGVLKQCAHHGLMTEAAYKAAIDLPPVRGRSPRKPPVLGAPELQRLAQVCRGDASPAGARDEALLAILVSANLRRSEAVALEIESFDSLTGVLEIRGSGDRATRRLLTQDAARRALERWILIRGPEPGPLFNPVNKGGRIERRRLSEQAIYIACQKRAAEAGLPPTSPEDLRRADVSRSEPRRPTGAVGPLGAPRAG